MHEDRGSNPSAEDLEVELKFLRQLVDLAPGIFYVIDEDTRVIFANEKALQFFGVRREDMVGHTLTDVFGAERAEAIMGSTRSTMDKEELTYTPEDVQFDEKGNRYYWELYEIPFRDPKTGKRAVLGVANDITKLREYERMARDLEIASKIQRGLLPSRVPESKVFDVAAMSRPAEQAGGDYYDWQELDDGRLIVTLADVTGHGIGPALVTAACRSYVRATADGQRAPVEILRRVNALLSDDLSGGRFVTFALIELSPESRSGLFLSAGHGPSFFLRTHDGQIDLVGSQGVPLGILAHHSCKEPIEFQFDAGDAFVLASDGFFEWGNIDGEQFGVERLAEVIRSHRGEPAERVIAAMEDT